MADEEHEPRSSSSMQTPRLISGTQPRPSYSVAELGTPSGEVVFNFGRRGLEDQANLPLGGSHPGCQLPKKTLKDLVSLLGVAE